MARMRSIVIHQTEGFTIGRDWNLTISWSLVVTVPAIYSSIPVLGVRSRGWDTIRLFRIRRKTVHRYNISRLYCRYVPRWYVVNQFFLLQLTRHSGSPDSVYPSNPRIPTNVNVVARQFHIAHSHKSHCSPCQLSSPPFPHPHWPVRYRHCHNYHQQVPHLVSYSLWRGWIEWSVGW